MLSFFPITKLVKVDIFVLRSLEVKKDLLTLKKYGLKEIIKEAEGKVAKGVLLIIRNSLKGKTKTM